MLKIIPKLFAIFTLVLLFNSCSSDDGDDGPMVPLADIPAINAALTSGDWAISYYSSKFGSDKTLTYSAYSFTFMADGVLIATDGTTSLSGLWSVIVASDEATGESLNHVEFNIGFSSPEEFVEISDDWDVRAWTTTTIDSEAVLGPEGGAQKITFTKK